MKEVFCKQSLISGDLLEVMKFIYCYDRNNFKSKFAEYNIPINGYDDLVHLYAMNKTGRDLSEGIINSKMEPIKININDFVKNTIGINADIINKKINFLK